MSNPEEAVIAGPALLIEPKELEEEELEESSNEEEEKVKLTPK